MKKIFLLFLGVLIYISSFSQTVNLIGKTSTEVILKASGVFMSKKYYDDVDSSYALFYNNPPFVNAYIISNDTCKSVAFVCPASELSSVITEFNKSYVIVNATKWLYYTEVGVLAVELQIIEDGAGMFTYIKLKKE